MTSIYIYTAHGLRIAVPFQCPELIPAHGTPDVTVILGRVPPLSEQLRSGGLTFEATRDELLLDLLGVGRFRVQNGREVTVEPEPGVHEDTLRLFLFGSCLGAILHQRGILALHASAVRTQRGAVLFLGESGAGKSTLAATLIGCGLTLIADDVCAVVPDQSGWPQVLPGIRHIKLWADAASRLAPAGAQLRRVRPGIDKYAMPVLESVAVESIPLYAAYVLVPYDGTVLRCEQIDGANRLAVLTEHTYREHYLDGLAQRPAHFRQVVMAAQVPLVRIERPRQPDLLNELAQRVLIDVA